MCHPLSISYLEYIYMALPNISLSDKPWIMSAPYLCGITMSDHTNKQLVKDEILENSIKYYFMLYVDDKKVHISCNHLRKCSIEFEISRTQHTHVTDVSHSYLSLSGNGSDYLAKILNMHKKWHDDCGLLFFCKDSFCLKSNQYTCTLCGKDIYVNFCDDHIKWHNKCPKMYHCYYISDNYDQYVCDLCFRSIPVDQCGQHNKYHRECLTGYKCIYIINDSVPDGYECTKCNLLILTSNLQHHAKLHITSPL